MGVKFQANTVKKYTETRRKRTENCRGMYLKPNKKDANTTTNLRVYKFRFLAKSSSRHKSAVGQDRLALLTLVEKKANYPTFVPTRSSVKSVAQNLHHTLLKENGLANIVPSAFTHELSGLLHLQGGHVSTVTHTHTGRHGRALGLSTTLRHLRTAVLTLVGNFLYPLSNVFSVSTCSRRSTISTPDINAQKNKAQAQKQGQLVRDRAPAAVHRHSWHSCPA